MAFRMIHCADLHLGRQQFGSSVRWEDFGKAFAYIVEYCLDVQADCMVISGDLFHERAINAATLSQASGILSKLKQAGIPVFAIEGNHDKALYVDKESWMQYLDRQGLITLLKPAVGEEGVSLEPYHDNTGCIAFCKGVRLIGLGYLGATTAQRLEAISGLIEPWQGPTIILLHAAVDKLMGQDMAGVHHKIFEAYREKADYFALGHIHSRQETGEFLYNPGAPECVHIDEGTGEKGFYDVTIENGVVRPRFVESRRRPLLYFQIDITNAMDAAGVVRLTMETLEKKREQLADAMARIVFIGQTSVGLSVDITELCQQVKETFGCLYVEGINSASSTLERGLTMEFAKKDLERTVVEEMVRERGERWKDVKGLEAFILQVKDGVLTGMDAETVAEAMFEMLEEKR